MRIALVTPFPSAPGRVTGGVAGVSACLAEELGRAAGVSVDVVVPPGGPGSPPSRELWPGVRVHRLARAGPLAFLPGTAYDAAAGKRRLHAYLRALAPDVVHYQGVGFLAAGSPCPSVLTIHGIAEKDAAFDGRAAPARLLKRSLLKVTEELGRRGARHVILISEQAAPLLSPDARVWRIANPVPERFFEIERRPEPGRVLSVSRVAPLKNLPGLIESFARAARARPPARLRVAGGGDPALLGACRRLAERLGVDGRVRFLGALSEQELREELSRAEAFALASLQENAPLCVAEAMAAGVPIAASRAGAVPEMLEEGACGLLFGAGDAAAGADALGRLLDDAGLRASLAARARARAESRHRASAVARLTLEVYRELAGS